MARKKNIAWDELAQEAAYLHAQHNMSQGVIAQELGCSQSQVSRLLKHAEERGWLKTEVRFVHEGIPPHRMEQIQRVLEPKKIVQELQHLASESGISLTVRVFDSGSNEDEKDPKAHQERLKKFGRTVAGRIQELLSHVRIVGVTWGNTLSQIIEGLVWSGTRMKQEHPIQFVPVCAELVRMDDMGIELSSSRLAHRLSEVINQKQIERFSLAGMPAFMPRYHGREKKDVDLLHKYLIDNSASYKKIFTEEPRLIDQIDTILTSVGSFSDPYPSRVKPELLKAWGIDADKVETLILGDLGGVLIPKPNLNTHDRKLVEELDRMWTGIKTGHLERIAKVTSANKNRPDAIGGGNIVVAIGAHKAPVIYEAIRLGLVNELIIDKVLAKTLEQRVGANDRREVNTSP
jgi:DNA-binding transcriptional regulator LsrR (DeoR family)